MLGSQVRLFCDSVPLTQWHRSRWCRPAASLRNKAPNSASMQRLWGRPVQKAPFCSWHAYADVYGGHRGNLLVELTVAMLS